ncbi:MAG TPA: hypothetical protein VFB58_16780 [Chloroflexota bacterium]|nr:hypothetical protein [Chloroflexota bacterium]
MTTEYEIGTYPYLRICGTCGHLYEEGRPDGKEQRCRCVPSGPKWEDGRDFNERASLCYCCGLEAVHSGSRWSPFFCYFCRTMAIAVSLWERRLIFPIGRHTLMHSWLPEAPPANLTHPGTTMTDITNGVLSTLDSIDAGRKALDAWSAQVMRHNLETVGLPPDVTLDEYLTKVAKMGLATPADKQHAFAGLRELYRQGRPGTPTGPSDTN